MSKLVEFVAADRLVDSQLWWVASELCRRHPWLSLTETAYEQVGSALEAVGNVDGREVRVGFSRAAGIRIKDRDFHVAVPELFTKVNPHEVLKRIEHAHGMGKPDDTPPTDGATIGYRAIAHVLNAMVNSRFSWTLRGERANDPHVLAELTWLGAASEWPTMLGLKARWNEDNVLGKLYETAPAQAWLLMRDLEPIAVFDRYGSVHTRTGKCDLLKVYREQGSNLTLAVDQVLGEWMK